MGRLFTLGVGVIVGVILMFFCFHYHVVKTSDKTLIVPKKSATLSETYVDISTWGIQEWSEHPDLADDMIRAGHSQMVRRSISQNLLDNIMDQFNPPSTRQ